MEDTGFLHKKSTLDSFKTLKRRHGFRYVAYEYSQSMTSALTGAVSVQRLYNIYVYLRPEWFRDRIMESKCPEIFWPFEIEYLKDIEALEEIHTLDKGVLLLEENYGRE